MQDELHAATIVEEALGDDGGLRGDCPENGSAGDDVSDELLCAALAESAFFHQPRDSCRDFGLRRREVAGRDVRRESGDLFAELADPVAENSGPLRGFALPERQRGWRAVGIFDQDTSRTASTRWMRQLEVPRRITSPGLESTAKCSSSVAIWTPSGWRMTL